MRFTHYTNDNLTICETFVYEKSTQVNHIQHSKRFIQLPAITQLLTVSLIGRACWIRCNIFALRMRAWQRRIGVRAETDQSVQCQKFAEINMVAMTFFCYIFACNVVKNTHPFQFRLLKMLVPCWVHMYKCSSRSSFTYLLISAINPMSHLSCRCTLLYVMCLAANIHLLRVAPAESDSDGGKYAVIINSP